MLKPKYKVNDKIIITKNIDDVKLSVDLFNERQEYIYLVDWIWKTEKDLLKEKPPG